MNVSSLPFGVLRQILTMCAGKLAKWCESATADVRSRRLCRGWPGTEGEGHPPLHTVKEEPAFTDPRDEELHGERHEIENGLPNSWTGGGLPRAMTAVRS